MKIKKPNQKHLIIGAGETGTALKKILSPHYEVAIRDIQNTASGRLAVLHICYPPIKNFVSATKRYIEEYSPDLVVIHATVPVGTTRKVGEIAVHSPIRGVHPNLDKGIKTFVKYFGGEKAKEAARIFSRAGVKTKVLKNPETTELLKILDTTYYAWNVVFAKETKRICDTLNLDFSEVYTIPNEDYNESYKKLGKPNVIRPVLKPIPGKIGGHCLIPNCELLDDWLTRIIKDRNGKY